MKGDGNREGAEAQADLMNLNPLFDLWRKRLGKGRGLSGGPTRDELVVESELTWGL